VSPRRTRPTRRAASNVAADDAGDTGLGGGFESIEFDAHGEEWVVRRLTGSSSTKNYRCPGCDHEIRPATPHIVAWPRDAIDQRRHWHTPCWQARARRSARELRWGR
jgi:hypothetical protein